MSGALALGVPLPGTDLVILDDAGKPVGYDEPGEVVVPARLFSDVVRNLVGEEVRVESGTGEGGAVLVTAPDVVTLPSSS